MFLFLTVLNLLLELEGLGNHCQKLKQIQLWFMMQLKRHLSVPKWILLIALKIAFI